ncbi:hypothetical protein AQJ11_43630 [Streptomyces corchorusii]|uniref:Uncharacterized protein n=1 Tax=Streptomyces corchorusii TaxID=1903 RepID=A0A101PP74_STRCK|nr:hypothetical protein SHJG_2128 [Streptomyces hygroscopicus subsp. jinggangensis 5008]AGF61559.1 hypothetical protein SHJGH_1893 [Streptomyces hygroscopicus subsp. jinggangensis TL01]KUN15135.1 hypothetical protein AQJ11_43630 [Streptomyces corchorusii]
MSDPPGRCRTDTAPVPGHRRVGPPGRACPTETGPCLTVTIQRARRPGGPVRRFLEEIIMTVRTGARQRAPGNRGHDDEEAHG